MSQDKLEGEVRGLRERTENVHHPVTNEPIEEQVWMFQLERRQEGQRLPPIPVEIRGYTFSGVLNEGHIVRLDNSTWQEGQTVRTNHVYNVTLNTPVTAKGKDNRGNIIVAIVILLAFLAWAIWGFSRF
jgi:hypothetical protein